MRNFELPRTCFPQARSRCVRQDFGVRLSGRYRQPAFVDGLCARGAGGSLSLNHQLGPTLPFLEQHCFSVSCCPSQANRSGKLTPDFARGMGI
jgi:hypothetical protein